MVVASTATCWNVAGLYKNFFNRYMCMVLDPFVDNNFIVMHGKGNILKSEDRSFQCWQSVSGWLSDMLCPV